MVLSSGNLRVDLISNQRREVALTMIIRIATAGHSRAIAPDLDSVIHSSRYLRIRHAREQRREVALTWIIATAGNCRATAPE